MDTLIRQFKESGTFSPGGEGPNNDRIRYTVRANRVFLRAQLTNASALLVTVPTGETWIPTGMRIHNFSGTDRLVTLKDVPSGESDTTEFQFIGSTITAGETVYLEINSGDVWEGGYKIYGHAAANSAVNVKIVGLVLLDS